MKIFADTSGLFDLLAQNDRMHIQAKEDFLYFAQQKAQLITSSFVLVETLALLLQRRIGIAPVQDFHSHLFPLLETIWVDGEWYNRGVQCLQALNNRDLSLVDCLSFEIMEFKEISMAFFLISILLKPDLPWPIFITLRTTKSPSIQHPVSKNYLTSLQPFSIEIPLYCILLPFRSILFV